MQKKFHQSTESAWHEWPGTSENKTTNHGTPLKKEKKNSVVLYQVSRIASNHLAETEERAEAYGAESNSMDRFMLP